MSVYALNLLMSYSITINWGGKPQHRLVASLFMGVYTR